MRRLYCAGCYGPLRSHITTDGHGGIVDMVEPCQNCLRQNNRSPYIADSAYAVPKPIRDSAGTYYCVICRAILPAHPRKVGAGRPPLYCREHARHARAIAKRRTRKRAQVIKRN